MTLPARYGKDGTIAWLAAGVLTFLLPIDQRTEARLWVAFMSVLVVAILALAWIHRRPTNTSSSTTLST
jgi:hypothetical protein